MTWLLEHYLWVKALHIMGVMAWMAGLFYLPRLFVYHKEHEQNSEFVRIVKIQEYKLFAYIMRPAMLLSVASGLLMIWLNPALFTSGLWLHIKLVLVVFMLIFHISCGRVLGSLHRDVCRWSGRTFRLFNEIPTLLMMGIVCCAVVRF